MTEAEYCRKYNASVEYINGFVSESLTTRPPASLMLDESNELTTGWRFSDGSEIWETWNGNTYEVYTTSK